MGKKKKQTNKDKILAYTLTYGAMILGFLLGYFIVKNLVLLILSN